MQIRTLETTATDDLAGTFNRAFSDYLFPFRLTEQEMAAKIETENIVLENSVGAFADGQLVGLILIGIDDTNEETFAYNAGTGVIPECRGQHLTEKMYGFLFAHLAKKQIFSHRLEVVALNQRAIPVYRKIGFETLRTFACFKGKVSESSYTHEIRTIDLPERANRFWNHEPAYQNTSECIKRSLSDHAILGAFVDRKIVGYIVFAANGRIKQFGVDCDFRRKGIGHALFAEVQKRIPDQVLSLINIDESDDETVKFLQQIGLDLTVKQYEMATMYSRK